MVTGDVTVLPETGLVTFTATAEEKAEKPQRNMSTNNMLIFFKMTPRVFVFGVARMPNGVRMHQQGRQEPCARARILPVRERIRTLQGSKDESNRFC
jgi:hypothetical protein